MSEQLENIKEMAALQVPDWLSATFLQTALQSDTEHFPEITITKLELEPAVPAGNNYGSILFRAKLQYKTQDNTEHLTSVIVKTIKLDYKENMGAYMDDIFRREPRYYNEFISEARKLCKIDIVPKSYKSSNSNCLILEDLIVSGFQMVDRHRLLDLNHCQLYIKASSKLHALSIAVHKKNPELIESLAADNAALDESNKQLFTVMMKCCIESMADFLKDKPKYKDCLDIIKELRDNQLSWYIFQKETPLMKALTQGDPWCTNMMFKYNSVGEVVGVKLIDFQSLKFVSPVEELLIFSLVSVQPAVRETSLDDFYHLYCDSFNQNLEELGCPERLSYDVLKAEVTSLSPYMIIYTGMLLPIVLADSAADFGDYFHASAVNEPLEERAFHKLYAGKHFNKYMPVILDQLMREGVFLYVKEKIQKNPFNLNGSK
uniref:CHK kinase-like domain-containing protein n=1 Tax=Graphocephala atropunctata TaxID=36148 RepID=A0A1B6LQ40_9HEMI